MRKPGPAYSIKRVVANIDHAIGLSDLKKSFKVSRTYIVEEDLLIDILDYYESNMGITFPKELAIETPHIKLGELSDQIADLATEQRRNIKFNDDDVIEYIEHILEEEDPQNDLNDEVIIFDNDQLIDVLEHFEDKYDLKIPVTILDHQNLTLYTLSKELSNIYKQHEAYEYIIIYAKLVEDKHTKETTMEGPFFGPYSNSKEKIEEKAKKLTENQQNSALLIKSFEKNGRSDAEVMKLAKQYFGKIQDNMEF